MRDASSLSDDELEELFRPASRMTTSRHRIVVWVAVAVLVFFFVRALGNARPTIPPGCRWVDYGRDAYVDC